MKSFHLSVAQFGIVASAFGWGYAPVVFVSGWIVSALGARRTYNWFVTLWSVLIAATAMAGSFGTLFILRLFFGASEGTVFPAAGQLIGKWLPFSERGRAAGLMLAGIPLGALLVVPLSVWLTRAYGWQVPFVVLGVLGIVWVLVANAIIVDSPHGDGAIAELVPVHSDRDEVLAGTEKRPPWGRIFRSRTLWLAGLASFSSAYGLYFMLSFFPTYLVRQRHVAFAAVALLGTVPWAAMVAGALVSGVVSVRVQHGAEKIEFVERGVRGHPRVEFDGQARAALSKQGSIPVQGVRAYKLAIDVKTVLVVDGVHRLGDHVPIGVHRIILNAVARPPVVDGPTAVSTSELGEKARVTIKMIPIGGERNVIKPEPRARRPPSGGHHGGLNHCR